MGIKGVLTKKNNGFTLMEMLIVVTIIGVLAAIVLPRFVTSQAAARDAAYDAEKQTINSQVELYYFTNGVYPTAMTESEWSQHATDGYLDYWPDGVPTSDVYGIAWVLDANTGRVVDQ